MRGWLWIFSAACVVAATLLARSDAEWFVLRLKAVKSRDRTVPDGIFAAVALSLVAAEAWAFRRAGVSWLDAAPLLLLSGYVPFTFLFYCNIVGIGTQREVSWMAAFLGLCSASWALFDSLRLSFILPPALALTAFFCRAALRDPYCRYRVGLRRLDERGDPGAAETALRQAMELAPKETRYVYHLGRALKSQGRAQEGEALIKRALDARPNLLAELRNDPFFRTGWLT